MVIFADFSPRLHCHVAQYGDSCTLWFPLQRQVLLVRITLLVSYGKREKEVAIHLHENLHSHDTYSLSSVVSLLPDIPLAQELKGLGANYAIQWTDVGWHSLCHRSSHVPASPFTYQTPQECCWLWVTAGVENPAPAEVTETRAHTHGDQ